LPGDAAIEVAEPIRDDLRRFIGLVEVDKSFDPESFDVPISREDGIKLLRAAYKLG
jgi:hypothetical protein